MKSYLITAGPKKVLQVFEPLTAKVLMLLHWFPTRSSMQQLALKIFHVHHN